MLRMAYSNLGYRNDIGYKNYVSDGKTKSNKDVWILNAQRINVIFPHCFIKRYHK